MAHRNPNAKPNKSQPTGNARRGNKDAAKQARQNAQAIKNDIKQKLTDFGKATSPKPTSGSTKAPAVSKEPVKRRSNDIDTGFPWVVNPKKKKFEEVTTRNSSTYNTNVRKPHTVKVHSDHAQSLHEKKHVRQQMDYNRQRTQDQITIDDIAKRLEDGDPYYLDPSTSDSWSPRLRLKYDPVTGIRRDLLEAGPILQKYRRNDPDFRVPEGILEVVAKGEKVASGYYSLDADDAYFKKLNKENYYEELLYNSETQQYEPVMVPKLNGKMPKISGDPEAIGKYYDTFSYKKNGKWYLREGAPEAPLEFHEDEEGNTVIDKVNYDGGILLSDGTWVTYNYSDADMQDFQDAYTAYCVFSNAAFIPARELTEQMKHTAGWDPNASDSLMDVAVRDHLHNILTSQVKNPDGKSPQDLAYSLFLDDTARLFKGVGGYLKNYLFTPLAKGDMQTVVLNGLVNLAETCDYMGVGTRALAAPKLGIEYDKGDSAIERLAKAYTTHENFEPDTGNAVKDIGIYMLDPSIVLTLGSMGLAKLAAKASVKSVMNPLLKNLVSFGGDVSKLSTPLKREYKAIARDIATADENTIVKHAVRLSNILKDSDYALQKYGGISEALEDEFINSLRALQNRKSFFLVKGTASASNIINSVDNVFLAGGLYLPFTVLKTVKGTRAILRNNKRIADLLVKGSFEKFQNAQRIFKNYSGNGSILDFHNVIDGFKSMKSLDATEALKSISAEKIRGKYLWQQRRLDSAVSKFASSSFGYTTRLGLLNDELANIFKIEVDGSGPKALEILEKHLIDEAAKASGVNNAIDDIFDNMLKTVRDAKDKVELARQNDVDSWISVLYGASTSREVQELYQQYLKANNAHPISNIENIAIERYKQLAAEERGIDKALIDPPDDMVVINSAIANDLDSVPLTKSSAKSESVNGSLSSIPHTLGDAPEATQKRVIELRDSLETLVKTDAEGNAIKDKNGAVQLIIDSYYTKDLFNYLRLTSGNKYSKISLEKLQDKIQKAVNSLKGKYGADLSALPNAEELSKFLEGAEDAKRIFIYKEGPEFMQELYRVGVRDYYELCRTIETPTSYIPPKKLREAKLEFQKNKLTEEGYRTAKREMAADPSGIVQRKRELKHKLKNTKIEKENGVVTTALAEYKTMVHELTQRAEEKGTALPLINELDSLYSDLVDVTALTAAQAEKAHEVNLAMSTFLNETLKSTKLQRTIDLFAPDGPYGYLIEYKDEIADFLRKNNEGGKELPNVDKLAYTVDSIATWCKSLNAYSNFYKTLDSYKLSPKEMDAVLELCLGMHPSHIHDITRNPKFYTNLQENINANLGFDNLLIEHYRETVGRTSFIDDAVWLPKHREHVVACEKELSELCQSDVKLQILQAVEMDPDAIRRFNNLAKSRDVYFLKTVTEGDSPYDPVIRIEMQKWVPVDEDISLPDLLKVLQDNDKKYSHVFEVSEDVTEQAVIKNAIDILDKSVKARSGVKNTAVPTIATHGRDVFDIDVLRQCCYRNKVQSLSLSNTNMLFTNRMNTFKMLMMKNRNHNCIDPDKIPLIAEAIQKFGMDLPDDAAFGIFNLSRFSDDLKTLFNTLSDPEFIKEVSASYDIEDPILKQLADTQDKIKVNKIDEFDQHFVVQDIFNTLEIKEAAEALDVPSEYKVPLAEIIREEQERIRVLPIDDEEKEARLAAVPEKIIANFEEKYELPTPEYFGTLNHVTAGLQSIKNVVSDMADLTRDMYYNLAERAMPFEYAGKFKDVYSGTTNHIVNLNKIFKELDDTMIPGTDINLSSLLSEDLRKELQRFVDDFGFDLSTKFSDKSALAHNINYLSDLEDTLNGLISRTQTEFNNIKVKAPSLEKTSPNISPTLRKRSVNLENETYVLKLQNRIPEYIEDTRVLPDVHDLDQSLLSFLSTVRMSPLEVFKWSNDKTGYLAKFRIIKDWAEILGTKSKIPQAVVDNLAVLSNIVDNITNLNFKEYQEFVFLLRVYRGQISDMLFALSQPLTKYEPLDAIEAILVGYNQKAAHLQQQLLTLQNTVESRMFRESLGITDASPFIRDVFNPTLENMNNLGFGTVVDTVKEEVEKLEHIRSSQVNSCFMSDEFEGFNGVYSEYDLPLGTSTQLKYDASGQALAVKKTYDVDNISRIADLSQTRTSSVISKDKPEIIQETVGLLEEFQHTEESLETVREMLASHPTEDAIRKKIKDLETEQDDLFTKLGEMLPSSKDYDDLLAETKPGPYKLRLEAQKLQAEKYDARVAEIDKELDELSETNINYHNEMRSRGMRNQSALYRKKQELFDRLVENYEQLKKMDTNDDLVVPKKNEREILNNIQYIIERTDLSLRVPVELSDIPAHELMSLNKFANRMRSIRDRKFKGSTFIREMSTINDWNAIISQTKKHAMARDVSDPYHYLVYLKEPETIEDAYIVADMLYNMFWKHLDSVKSSGLTTMEKSLTNAPTEYQTTVSRIIQSGFNSVELKIENEAVLKLLQGNGLDLVYKGVPKSYFGSVYFRSKISGKHATAATIADVLATQNTRRAWARKFAPSDNTIREEAFAELENSQIEAVRILEQIADTPYERACRKHLDNVQNELYKAQTLQVMDFITKDVEHLITHLIYHNHQLVLPLKYSDGFEVYGKYLTKLKEMLSDNPMYINYKFNDYDGYLWVGLDNSTNPRIINDTKHVKENTQFELDGKLYDPTEMNEAYRHIDLSDDIEFTEEMLKGISSEKQLLEYCERLTAHARTAYGKLDFLSEGAIKGSAINPYSLSKHRAIRKAAPVDWLANSIRNSATCDQRLFHTSQFDFTILGENEYRLKLGNHYDDTDILQNIKQCYDDLAGTVSTERMYIANYFDNNSHCRLENLFRGYSNAEKLSILKNNPDQCVLVLEADKKTLTGFRVRKLRIIDELSIRQAEAQRAIVADYETYVEMTRVLNNSEFDKTWMKVWARVVFFLKVGHLCNPGTWMRNWIDATLKATGEVDGNIAKTAIHQIKAMKYLFEYNKIVKEVRDTYGVHHITSRRLDSEWEGIQRKTGTTMTKRQFDFVEGWLKVSLSGGESRMLQEMLKKQKYDPWRSGNLKPGNSFTSAGRKAMRDEYDYIGSDIYRFEQIGEDEITKLIEESYRKGENVFVDDFSIDEFWQIFNQRKNPETAIIEDSELFQKYKDTVTNLLTIRSNNLFRGNRGLGSQLDYMCSMFLKPMSKIEQVVRLGQFLMLESEGFTRSEIFKSIADTQFEYELKSSRVKGAELFLTYFNFEYNNLRYWCNLLEQKPEYLYVLEQMWDDLSWNAAQEYYEDEDVFNNRSIMYMMANGALPIGKSGLYLKMQPSALGALNWFYSMPSQFANSVVPPAELLLKEFALNMGGDYAQLFMSNMDYSYSDQETWEKALALVPIAGTMYTRYWQHFNERKPWTRLDNDVNGVATVGRDLVHYNPSVFGAVYKYNKQQADDFDAFQKGLEKQGLWYDCNSERVVDIKYKNTYGLNDPNLPFDELDTFKRIYKNEAWDNNYGGFKSFGHFDRPDKALFDEEGNPKDLGLNRKRNLSIPGQWEALEDDMLKYHGRLWDRNTDKFVPFWEWKKEKLNRDDLSFSELCEYMAEKGKYWDNKDKCFKSVPEAMTASNGFYYYYRGWRHFRRWVNYGNNPPARKYIPKPYNTGNLSMNISGKLFNTSEFTAGDMAALRMAVTGEKAYTKYYSDEFKYNYRYRMPNPINHMRRYNPIIRYHIIPS